jgi:hypothetical protein
LFDLGSQHRSFEKLLSAYGRGAAAAGTREPASAIMGTGRLPAHDLALAN